MIHFHFNPPYQNFQNQFKCGLVKPTVGQCVLDYLKSREASDASGCWYMDLTLHDGFLCVYSSNLLCALPMVFWSIDESMVHVVIWGSTWGFKDPGQVVCRSYILLLKFKNITSKSFYCIVNGESSFNFLQISSYHLFWWLSLSWVLLLYPVLILSPVTS